MSYQTLCCDGVTCCLRLDLKKNHPVFEMTDPAIHYKERTSRDDFGRTDLGVNGIEDFFRTHVCSDLCRMVCRQWVDAEDTVIHYDNILNLKSAAEKKSKKRVRFNV